MTTSRDIAPLMNKRLLSRLTAYAIQRADGKGYKRVTPSGGTMKGRVLIEHIEGETSIGHYLIDPDTNRTKLFAFDIDPDDGEPRERALEQDPEIWHEMLVLAQGLAQWTNRVVGTRSMVSYGGGKGVHVLCPIKGGFAAEDAVKAAEAIMHKAGFAVHSGANFWKSSSYPLLTLEVFPKQVDVDADGFGNLMRLPLGFNARYHREAYFVPRDVTALGFKDDPIETLTYGTVR